MHEMALCEGLVQILEEQARTQRYTRVKQVWLEVGALAGVEIEALRFGFDVVTRGTLAEGARLHVVRTPGQGWCLPCARAVELADRLDPCPQCGSHQIQITGGEEMRIRELEVD